MNEELILTGLVYNEDYVRKVLPFLQRDYFQGDENKIIFDVIEEYINKYNTQPTKSSLNVEFSEKMGISEQNFKKIEDFVDNLEPNTEKTEWLVEKTEKYCQERAIYNAIRQSIQILDDKDPKFNKNSIPEILSNALGVNFDSHIGHNFVDDSNSRYDFYHRIENKVPFDLEFFNKITNGGLSQKSLNMIIAGTGVGKTMFMCHCAASNFISGKNVLYITMEMAEEKIAERIDANLLNVTVDELAVLDKTIFDKKIERIKSRTKGQLIIKEYPTASAGSLHFKNLLQELRLKKNFVPDIIFIDYLNICISSRIKRGGSVNSYEYIKSIAEELRGLAVEQGVPIVSATQTTRSGFSNNDLGLDDTSESFGLPATADMMFALIVTDELHALNQVMVKQLKNRYRDYNIDKRFVIGVDRPKMKFYDVEQSAQEDIMDGPVMDKTSFGNRSDDEEFGKALNKGRKKRNTKGFNH